MSVHYVPAKPGGRAPTPDILGAVLTGEERDVTETAEIMNGLVWDYAQAGANSQAVIEHTVELKRSERRASEAIIEAGRHLLAVQELMPPGTWLDWLSVEFKMSKSTAYNMIGIAKRFSGELPKIGSLAPSVLYLLAGDSVPEEAREEVIERSQAGERVTVATAKAVIEEHKPKERFYLSNDDVPAELRATGWEVRSKDIDAWWFVNTGEGGGMETAVVKNRGQFDAVCRELLARLEKQQRQVAKVKAWASVVVDAVDEMDGGDVDVVGGERPVTAAMRAAQRAIWNWLADQCGAANFGGIVELAEALHYQEAQHPLWFRMYPRGADIDDVYWALEACIDQAAAAVPAYSQPQTAAFVPTANLKAAVIGWLRAQYPDYYGQVAALQCMIADPMHDEDVQRMEPTLPAPYRKDDLLVAMMQASAYLDSLKDDEPEGEESHEDAVGVPG